MIREDFVRIVLVGQFASVGISSLQLLSLCVSSATPAFEGSALWRSVRAFGSIMLVIGAIVKAEINLFT
jgi:hypothetical protein